MGIRHATVTRGLRLGVREATKKKKIDNKRGRIPRDRRACVSNCVGGYDDGPHGFEYGCLRRGKATCLT